MSKFWFFNCSVVLALVQDSVVINSIDYTQGNLLSFHVGTNKWGLV